MSPIPKQTDVCLVCNVCRNLIKKPWAFIRFPYMNPSILGV